MGLRRVSVPGGELSVLEQGRGSPLLFVHGFPLDHSMWRSQIEFFSAHFRVIAPDLRGFGSSSVVEDKVTMDDHARDLFALLDALEIHEPTHVVALSMGGYIAFRMIEQAPSRLRSMVLCDTRSVADTPEVARGRLVAAERLEREGSAFLAETMVPRLFGPVTLQSQQDLVERIRSQILQGPAKGFAASQRGMAERPDSGGMLASIQIPTLVICGEADAISPPDEMRQIARSIPNARFCLIPGAGHMAPLECPNEVNGEIQSFLGANG